MLPEESQRTFVWNADTADLDGDGLADLVLSGTPGFSAWRGVGDGRFVETAYVIDFSINITDHVLFDADGDGSPDLAIAVLASCFSMPTSCHAGQNRLWLGDGSGGFVDVTSGAPQAATQRTRDVAAGDLDGDGDQDLVWGNDTNGLAGGNENEVWTNDGDGGFTASVPFSPALFSTIEQPTMLVELADLDGDGDLDVYTADSRSRLYLNDGFGSFEEDPQPLSAPHEPVSVCLEDLDVDGSVDLVVAYGSNSGHGGETRVYRNSAGLLTYDSVALPPVAASTIVAGDIDGDGAPDLLLGRGLEVRIVTSDGAGLFADAGPLPETSYAALPPASMLLADLDGDADNDLVLVVPLASQLYLNDGAGLLGRVTATVPWETGFPRRALALDANGDGHSDVAVINGGRSSRSDLFLSDGAGVVRQAPLSDWNDSSMMSDLAAADLDEDGDADLVAPNSASNFGAGLYINDGSASFVEAFPFQGTAAARQVAVADYDGDGRPDVILGESPIAFRNAGGGLFSSDPAALPAGANLGNALLFGDYQNDGDPDLFSIGSFGVPRLYRNDEGVFVDASTAMPGFPEDAANGALGDVNGDGELDLVVGTNSVTMPFSSPNRLFLGAGAGGFTDASANIPAVSLRTTACLLADFDLDGDQDIFWVNELVNGSSNTYLENTGASVFVDVPAALPAAALRGLAGAVLDLDDDLDPDVFVGGQGSPDLLFNTRRGQLAWTSAPRLGGQLPFAAHGPVSGHGWLLFSSQTIRLPLPNLGILRLDPTFLELVTEGDYDAQGKRSFTLPLPTATSLIDVPLYLQTLQAPPLALGNLEIVRLRAY